MSPAEFDRLLRECLPLGVPKLAAGQPTVRVRQLTIELAFDHREVAELSRFDASQLVRRRLMQVAMTEFHPPAAIPPTAGPA